MTATEFFVEAEPDDPADGRHLVEFGNGLRLMLPVDMMAVGLALLEFASALASSTPAEIEAFAGALVAAGAKAVRTE